MPFKTQLEITLLEHARPDQAMKNGVCVVIR